MLKLSFLARRHPVNKLRVEQIRDELIADYTPATTMERASCAHLAAALERLESLKAGSQEHKRVIEIVQLLGTALDEARRSRREVPKDNLEDLTNDELIARAERLLKLAHENRDLQRHTERAAAAEKARTDEQRKQAEVRKAIGWDVHVLNEQTGYRP